MPCPVATGPCAITADGSGIAPKTYNPSLAPLTTIFVEGAADSFTVTFSTGTSYPTHTVKMVYRHGTESFDEHDIKTVSRDTGTISSASGLANLLFFTVLLRPETATEYGDWQRTQALTDAGWDSDAEFVTHLGAFVTSGGVSVFY